MNQGVPKEDPIAMSKRIFTEVGERVANMEPEEISQCIRQCVHDEEELRETHAALRKFFADKVSVLDDERLKKLREYVPIPPSVYKDHEHERRTRPSKSEDSATSLKARKKPQSSATKNISSIAKALGMTEEQATVWLAEKQAQHLKKDEPALSLPPVNGDEISQSDLDKEAAENEIDLPE